MSRMYVSVGIMLLIWLIFDDREGHNQANGIAYAYLFFVICGCSCFIWPVIDWRQVASGSLCVKDYPDKLNDALMYW